MIVDLLGAVETPTYVVLPKSEAALASRRYAAPGVPWTPLATLELRWRSGVRFAAPKSAEPSGLATAVGRSSS